MPNCKKMSQQTNFQESFMTFSLLFVSFCCFIPTEATNPDFFQYGNVHNGFIHIGSRAEVFDRSKSNKAFAATNYYASQDAVTWTTALQVCSAIFGGNASLLSMETEAENIWINGYLSTRGIIAGIYWTSGMYDIGAAVWRWRANPDADFNTFTSWGPGQPNSLNGRQRVIVNFLNTSSHWESSDDSVLNRMLCEVPVEEVPPVEGEPIICWDPMSIIVLLDASSILGPEAFQMAQIFASNLSIAFNHVVGKRFGFITFSLLPQSVIHIRQSLHEEVIQNVITSTGYQNYSERNTQDALLHGMIQLENYSEDAPKHMLVITGGRSELPEKTREIAYAANAAGIRTYALGVSYPNPGNELRDIAGGFLSRVFQAEWDRLEDLLPSVSEAVCME